MTTDSRTKLDWLICERGVPDVLPFSLYSPLKAGSRFQTETFWNCLDVLRETYSRNGSEFIYYLRVCLFLRLTPFPKFVSISLYLCPSVLLAFMLLSLVLF